MSKAIALKRLTKEYQSVKKNPDDLIEIRLDEDNMLNVYYIITGSPNTPFEGGKYFGLIKAPENYPFSPPSIIMYTPNGRFKESTKICLSMSDFHPESWNAGWSVTRTIPMALLSFMNSDEFSSGCVSTTDDAKRRYAKGSLEWNCRHPMFKKIFPDKIKEYEQLQKQTIIPQNVETDVVGESDDIKNLQTSPLDPEDSIRAKKVHSNNENGDKKSNKVVNLTLLAAIVIFIGYLLK
ncbi:related to Ubiquitin-conjugating enzyme E2 6 [Hanseniaspora guilliermondii]|uniref:Related to Ubiquitin-conjugating enzyme E2 6 n=1 Tax=Hanseniaspora guilliermondii TaxID=56406 RepID=A0A1L0B0U2_9ASCO|nr:related to Ubiquitin-conjugating enzyme E2 6 [Hanseniaspora guilliermondii]